MIRMVEKKKYKKKIELCLSKDKSYFLKRINEINTAKELDNLNKKIEISIQTVKFRKARIPQVNISSSLPIKDKEKIILEQISSNQVLILLGETGSGKSTQIPKICLKAGRGIFGAIGQTQPRRLAVKTISQKHFELWC